MSAINNVVSAQVTRALDHARPAMASITPRPDLVQHVRERHGWDPARTRWNDVPLMGSGHRLRTQLADLAHPPRGTRIAIRVPDDNGKVPLYTFRVNDAGDLRRVTRDAVLPDVPPITWDAARTALAGEAIVTYPTSRFSPEFLDRHRTPRDFLATLRSGLEAGRTSRDERNAHWMDLGHFVGVDHLGDPTTTMRFTAQPTVTARRGTKLVLVSAYPVRDHRPLLIR